MKNYDNIRHATIPVGEFQFTPNPMIGMDEMALLLTLCNGKDSILEIGTWRGITTDNILNVAGHVVSIDVTEPPRTLTGCQGPGECLPKHEIGAEISDENRRRCTLAQYNPNEPGGLRNLLSSIGGEYDVIVVDGDHSKEGVEIDYVEAHRHLKRDGVMIFHDCWWDVSPEPVSGPLILLNKVNGFILNKTHYGITEDHANRIGLLPDQD